MSGQRVGGRDTNAKGTLYAFDFDGVICDSATETAKTGLTGLQSLYAHQERDFTFTTDDINYAVAEFSTARPCLETGWEAVPMMYLLLKRNSGEELLNRFQSDLKQPTIESSLNSTADALKRLFSDARTTQIESDKSKWLASHGFYQKAVDVVKQLVANDDIVYVITTKAKDFTLLLLAAAALVIPEERIFGLGSGPKPKVLADVLARHADTHASCVFVEDRVKTLMAVQSPDFADVAGKTTLVLASWGYNTVADRATAAAHGMLVVDAEGLHALCVRE